MQTQGLLDNSGAVTKRLFTFGQYSRFVRPNYNRINATSSQVSELISAYKDSASPAFAVVVVNTNAATGVFQTINLANFTAASVTPWITTATLSLAPQTPVTVTNASFTYFVPAMSVVTFVGRGNAPPVIGAVPNQTINAGVTLLVTNTATDSDLPAQTLTFTAASAFPGRGDAYWGASGVFSWRPHVSRLTAGRRGDSVPAHLIRKVEVVQLQRLVALSCIANERERGCLAHCFLLQQRDKMVDGWCEVMEGGDIEAHLALADVAAPTIPLVDVGGLDPIATWGVGLLLAPP